MSLVQSIKNYYMFSIQLIFTYIHVCTHMVFLKYCTIALIRVEFCSLHIKELRRLNICIIFRNATQLIVPVPWVHSTLLLRHPDDTEAFIWSYFGGGKIKVCLYLQPNFLKVTCKNRWWGTGPMKPDRKSRRVCGHLRLHYSRIRKQCTPTQAFITRMYSFSTQALRYKQTSNKASVV